MTPEIKIGFLEEQPGEQSSYRFIMVMFFVAFCAGFFFIVLVKRAFPEIPYGYIVIAGMVIAGKGYQKHKELQAPTGPPSGAPPPGGGA